MLVLSNYYIEGQTWTKKLIATKLVYNNKKQQKSVSKQACHFSQATKLKQCSLGFLLLLLLTNTTQLASLVQQVDNSL